MWRGLAQHATAGVVGTDRRRRDLCRAVCAVRKIASGLKPRHLSMRALDELLTTKPTVERDHAIEDRFLLIGQGVSVTARDRRHGILTPVGGVKPPNDWTIPPRLDWLHEQRLSIPDHAPGLGVVHEFLQRLRAEAIVTARIGAQDVRSNV